MFDPVEFLDAGPDCVVVLTEVRGRGKDSGTPFEQDAAWVYELRDGKIVYDRPFGTKAEVLRAATIRT